MGLDTTHNAYHGSYGGFGHMRNAVGQAAGYQLVQDALHGHVFVDVPTELFTSDHVEGEWGEVPEDPLMVLFCHSDCDGVIHPREAAALEARLREVIPMIPEVPDTFMRDRVTQFADGLKRAAEADEDVEFW